MWASFHYRRLLFRTDFHGKPLRRQIDIEQNRSTKMRHKETTATQTLARAAVDSELFRDEMLSC